MNFLLSQNYLIKVLLLAFVLTINYDTKLNVVNTKKSYVFYCLITAICSQIPYWIISKFYVQFTSNNIPKGSEVSEIVHIIEVWSVECGFLLLFWSELVCRNNQVKFLNELIAIENEIRKMQPLKCYNQFKKLSVALLIGAIAFYLALWFIKSFYIFKNEILLQLSLLYYMCFAVLMDMFAILILMVVKMQREMFKALNHQLAQNTKNLSNCNIRKLKQILVLRNKLSGTMKMFNGSFGVICLAFFLYGCGIQTCFIFNGPFLLHRLTNATTAQTFNGFMNIFWLTPLLILLSLLGLECQKTKTEADSTYSLLGSLKYLKHENILDIVI